MRSTPEAVRSRAENTPELAQPRGRAGSDLRARQGKRRTASIVGGETWPRAGRLDRGLRQRDKVAALRRSRGAPKIRDSAGLRALCKRLSPARRSAGLEKLAGSAFFCAACGADCSRVSGDSYLETCATRPRRRLRSSRREHVERRTCRIRSVLGLQAGVVCVRATTGARSSRGGWNIV